MQAIGFEPAWTAADVDVRAVWAASGAAWLTDPAAGTPSRLVREVVGLARYLDHRGAGIGDLVPGAGVGLLAERAAILGLSPAGRVSCGGASRLLPAADGWLALTLARLDDVELVPAWLDGEPPPAGADADPWPAVERAVAGRPVAELVERAGWLGLPCAAVAEMTDRRAVAADLQGEAPPGDLTGCTVVNLGALWAAPLCGDLLARCGARLVTVESTTRPDGVRQRPAFFEALHGRSWSLALDLSHETGRRQLLDLLSRADVVIEGSRPRALAQLGVDADRLVATGPRVWLSITGHGRAAPARVGFGDDAAAAGGLVARVAGRPRFVADAVADPLTGLVAAATVAQLVEAGGRWSVDVALARVARAMAGDWFPAGDRTPSPVRPVARRDPGGPMPLGRDNHRLPRLLG